MPDVSLNGIEFTIKGDTSSAVVGIDRLQKALSKLQKIDFKNMGLKQVSSEVERFSKTVKTLDSAKLEAFSKSLKTVASIGNSFAKLGDGAAFSTMASSLDRISAMDFSNLDGAAENISDIAAAMKELGETGNVGGADAPYKAGDPTHQWAADMTRMVESSDKGFLPNMRETADTSGVEKFASALGTLGTRFSQIIAGAIGAARAAKNFGKATERVGTSAKNAGTTALKWLGKGLALPFKEAAKPVKNFAGGIKGITSALGRIAMYRLFRAIIKEITQALGEGIKNLYGWSKAMGGATISGKNFAQTMDGLATSSLYFKNSIGAMVAPIISALAPAIDFVIDKIVALINVINQLFALLGGATSWNKAIRKASEFEDAAGGAGGAAKEALRYLAPFDELNVLPDDKNGGGGGGAAENYSDMFEEVEEFQSGLKDFVDSLKQAISEGDWQGVGELLGGKVNELIDKVDFAGIGAKVGEYINDWFTAKYWTLNTINFQNIGAKVAEFLTGDNGIGGALRNIDFETVGRSFVQNFTILPDMIIGFLQKADWSSIGKSVGDYLRGALNEAADWASKVDWGQLVEDIFSAIISFVDGFDVSGLLKSVGKIVGAVSGAVVDAAGTIVLDVVEVFTNPDKWALAKTFFSDNVCRGILQAGIDLANGLAEKMSSGINSIIEKYNDLAKHLNLPTIDPIDLKLIPDLDPPVGTFYKETKDKLEEESKKSPTAFDSTANYVDWSVYGQKGTSVISKFTTWNSTANWNKQTVDSKWGGTTWNSTANWKRQIVDPRWAGTTWNSTANWKWQTVDQKWGGTTWNSTANFTRYTVHSTLKDSSGDMKINGTFNVVKLTGLKSIGQQKALGGVFSGGVWKDIPQYAGGTSKAHGSLFVAGEAGPEVVGHIGGRTEVLNRSQLAATMYSAVHSALAGVSFNIAAAPVASASATDGETEDMLYRAFSRALADSDIGGDIELDGNVLYRAMVNRNRQNTRMTGVNAMA